MGDPRFAGGEGPEGPYLLPPFILIAGGSYPIGSDEGQEEDERPAHQVDIQSFEMAQCPVTNAEWALFLKAGGYEDERWWATHEAKAWQRGENTADGPRQNWREWRNRFKENPGEIRNLLDQGRIISDVAEAWEKYRLMGDEEFEAVLAERWPGGRLREPAFWKDEAFNNPQQPVVGVCWHEARGYCAWLSAQTGERYRLPTEVEWESAARGKDGRRFAYGNEFDPACSNTLETHVRRTTPVGVFPAGHKPEGLMDMTGNVWDWTSSLYRPYPYQATDGRENPINESGRRVRRGGSWHDYRRLAHAAYRDDFHPNDRLDHLGFRVVRSSPIS